MQQSRISASPQRPRPIPRHVFVASIETLSPAMRRVTFEGSDLETFAWSGPAAHVKVVFPDGATGRLPSFSPGTRPTTMRTYTPRSFNAIKRLPPIDFVLHGEEIGSEWTSRAHIGDELVIFGPAPGYVIDTSADWYVLGCDAAALPAIETLLEALPLCMPVTVFAEVADAREQRLVPRSADVRWIKPGTSGEPALATALARLTWPPGDGRVYVGCESTMVRAIRRHLLETLQFEPGQITTRGDWRVGQTNHPDHDFAEEVGK